MRLETKDIKTCKNLNFEHDLDIDKLIGDWYPISKSDALPILSSCDLLTFSKPTDSTTSILTGEIKNRKKSNSSSIKLDLTSTTNPNSFTFKYLLLTHMLTVLDTDYDTYAVVYTCSDMWLTKMYNYVILSRTSSLPSDVFSKINDEIKTKTQLKSGSMINQAADTCPATIAS